jgi:hypothetical protein
MLNVFEGDKDNFSRMKKKVTAFIKSMVPLIWVRVPVKLLKRENMISRT